MKKFLTQTGRQRQETWNFTMLVLACILGDSMLPATQEEGFGTDTGQAFLPPKTHPATWYAFCTY